MDIDPGDPRWVGLWWGGFLLGGLLLKLVAIPFFAFPKELVHEKEKIKLAEKCTKNSTSQPASKNDNSYGKDLKGKLRR